VALNTLTLILTLLQESEIIIIIISYFKHPILRFLRICGRESGDKIGNYVNDNSG
jgi:hypothetical protein